MKVLSETVSDICINDMKDGDIGVVTKWGDSGYGANVIGKVLQRYGDDNSAMLIALGQPHGSTHTTAMLTRSESHRVRVLPPGTKLEI